MILRSKYQWAHDKTKKETLVKKHLDLLGYEVEDKVSDYKGVVISISFDLYGCIQADVRPRELGENGLPKQGYWLDVSRLRVVSKNRLWSSRILSKGR